MKPSYVQRNKHVFKDNERVNLFGEWNYGFFAYSAIGALNVGSICLNFDPTLKTNTNGPIPNRIYDLKYDDSEE